MAVPSLRTWSSGEIATAAMLNSNIRDPVRFLLNRPYLYLTNSANLSIPASTWTLLTWDTELADTDNMHSIFTNPSRVTVVTAGLYDIAITGRFAATSTTDTTSRAVMARVNAGGSPTAGTRLFDGQALSACSAQIGVADTIETSVESGMPIFLNAGDVVEFFAWQDTASALALTAQASGDQWSWASMRWLAAA